MAFFIFGSFYYYFFFFKIWICFGFVCFLFVFCLGFFGGLGGVRGNIFVVMMFWVYLRVFSFSF